MGRSMGRAINHFWLSSLITGILDFKQCKSLPKILNYFYSVQCHKYFNFYVKSIVLGVKDIKMNKR